jgi:hypothetical protein
MPKRTEQHQTGDLACAAVQRVVAEAGYAVERVQNDYGEDLLVQAGHDGVMDATRLWLQVKGTRTIARHTRKDGFAYAVRRDHVVRWRSSADPVIVVLWDLVGDRGYYAWSDAAGKGDGASATVTLPFRRRNAFTPDGVRNIAWFARFFRFDDLVLRARAAQDHRRALGRDDNVDLPAAAHALELLRLLGVVEHPPGMPANVRFTEKAWDVFSDAFVEYRQSDRPRELQVKTASLRTIVQLAAGSSGWGIPNMPSLFECVSLVEVLARDLLRHLPAS